MECCDTWQLSTVAIETRGARIKRYGRTLVSWRPLCQGFTVFKYMYINRASGQLREGLKTYKSSPMHQILERLVLSEESWHSDAGYNKPERERLRASLQAQLLKIEVEDAPTISQPSMLSEITQKL
eukprot:6084075-Prymnesium_polylepis.1